MAKVKKTVGTFQIDLSRSPECYPENPRKYEEGLSNRIAVGITTEDNEGLVVYGASPPGTSQQGYLWVRSDSAGNPMGLWRYIKGKWVQVPSDVNQFRVYWFYGSSNEIQPGYKLADGSGGLGIPDLRSLFRPAGENPPYTYYAAVWVGL